MELSELRNLTAERIVLFSLLLFGAAVLLVVALFVGLPVVPLAPAKLAVPLTLSSLLALTAFSSLRGLPAQLSSMLRGDSAPISTALILSMAFCLYSAFIGSYVFTICAAVLQVGTVIAYTVSAFPGGATGAKFLASSLGSTVLRSLGLSLGEESSWLPSVTQGNGITAGVEKHFSSVSDSLSSGVQSISNTLQSAMPEPSGLNRV
jgi:hypothetical protein